MSVLQISKLHPNVVFRNHERSFFPFFGKNPPIDTSSIFKNQIDFASDIYNKFLDRSIHSILAIALTQSGKTGAILSLIDHFSNSMPIQNAFVITGHSSTDWLKQTKERLPTSLVNNVFHRNTLDDFASRIALLTNIIIFIDESQIACLNSQAIHNALLKGGISSDSIYYRDIKFVLVSATPNSCITRFVPTRAGHDIAFMTPAIGYFSIFNFFKKGLVFQSRDLCGYDKKTSLVDPIVLDHIRAIPIGDVPKYHIIRTHNSFKHNITIRNFKSVFPSARFISQPNLSILSIKPFVHTFIFIKETLRCANTIDKLYLGVLYERFSRVSSDSAIIQGLAGRATGYHHFPITIFTHIPSILRYRALWRHRFINHRSIKSSWQF